MQQDNFAYKTTTSPTVFVIHFTGTNLKDIKVVIALGDDEDSDLVVFVTVTPKATMPPTADFRAMLLKFNHEFDQVKVGFDRDDDLSVRIDGSMRVADATYVKNVINQIKNSSDEIYGKIQSQLVSIESARWRAAPCLRLAALCINRFEFERVCALILRTPAPEPAYAQTTRSLL